MDSLQYFAAQLLQSLGVEPTDYNIEKTLETLREVKQWAWVNAGKLLEKRAKEMIEGDEHEAGSPNWQKRAALMRVALEELLTKQASEAALRDNPVAKYSPNILAQEIAAAVQENLDALERDADSL